MKASQFFISTLKEAPAEAALASHKLMIRAGLIKVNASGLYTWMPMGLRVLRKVENVVREEMARAGSVELLMPVVQPAELWQESGRWEFYGKELLRLKDRHDRDFCMGPTCEEVIADIVRKEINSYKQLPKNFYHIQTKFRDEVRPRFGVMRAREFVMKDAYSFHADYASLQTTYDAMYDAYCRIFTRLGLEFRPVAADTGSIGGTGSHEFQVLAESGEDVIAYSDTSDYAANIELAPTLPLKGERATAQTELTKVHTPDVKTIDSLVDFLSIPIEKTLKSIVVEGENEGEIILLLLRGDHEFNDIKAEKLAGVKSPLTMADPAAIRAQFGANGGSLGPVGFTGKVYADFATEKARTGLSVRTKTTTTIPASTSAATLPSLSLSIAQRRRRRRKPRRTRSSETGARHRSRTRLPVARQIHASHERKLPRQQRQIANHGNGLLRHRHYPRRCRRHRAEQRRKRHHLDQSDGAV